MINLNKVIITTILFFLFMIQTVSAKNSSIHYAESDGISIYKNGQQVSSISAGLPDNYSPLRIFKGKEYIYLTTQRSGVFRIKRTENKWSSINSKILKRRTTLSNINEYRKITAFCISTKNTKKLYLATKHTIFISYNRGKSWAKLKTPGFNNRNYITALYENNNTLFIGTSANGIFTSYKHNKFKKISKGLPNEPYTSGLLFYDEVTFIKSGNRTGELYAGFLFGKGIYYSKNLGRSWKKLNIPLKDQKLSVAFDIYVSRNELIATTSEGIFKYLKRKQKWTNISIDEIKANIFDNDEFSHAMINLSNKNSLYISVITDTKKYLKTKNRDALNIRALYTTIWQLKKNTNKLIKTLKFSGHNALVVDIKDDWGKIHIPMPEKLLNGIQKRKKSLWIKDRLKRLHDNGIYVIARLVVFKDKQLYNSFNHKYAIWNKHSNSPWRGNEKEYWVDPFSPFVRNYNIRVAQETAKLGFDEIQFDYIRFPSDGPTHKCYFRYKANKDSYKSEILADFLQQASNLIDVPISVDIYGFNGCYRFGNTIGQDIDVYARFADAVCPMVYPSHFGSRYMNRGPRSRRPYNIVYSSGIRSLYLSGYQAIIRPYIQAFNLLSPTWGTDYIKFQIDAANESNCSGYTFWNAAGEYKMVTRALAKNNRKSKSSVN